MRFALGKSFARIGFALLVVQVLACESALHLIEVSPAEQRQFDAVSTATQQPCKFAPRRDLRRAANEPRTANVASGARLSRERRARGICIARQVAKLASKAQLTNCASKSDFNERRNQKQTQRNNNKHENTINKANATLR